MSLNRPNAPKHLPSVDLDHSYFRAWALRGSETHSPGGVSVNTSSTSTPSPVSPTTLVAQRKAKYAERRRIQSESFGPPTPALRGPRSVPTVFGDLPAGIVLEDEPQPPLRAKRSIQSSISNESSPSSLSTESHTLLSLPGIRIAFNATKDRGPPREAREGYEWQDENTGHWLEVQLGRPRRLRGRAHPVPENSVISNAHTDVLWDRNGSTKDHTAAPSVSDKSVVTNVASGGDPFAAYTDDTHLSASRSTDVMAKEMLYCRTKRFLGLKRSHPEMGVSRTGMPSSAERSMTGNLLERTASALRTLVRVDGDRRGQRGHRNDSVSTGDLSIAALRWSRLRSPQSASDASSLRSLNTETTRTLANLHASTPEPEAMYMGSDHHKYLSVELTEPGAPTFLPSEARRIKTPPLASPRIGNKKLRGFFFDINSPPDEHPSSSMDPVEGGTAKQQSRIDSSSMFLTAKADGNAPERQRRISETEWYRVEMHAIEEEEAFARQRFASAIPEHLPSSPMCPRNPKHKSKGTGTCMYHGGRLE